MSDYEFWNELESIFEAVTAYQKKNLEFNKVFISPWVQLGRVFPHEDSGRKSLQDTLHAVELEPQNIRLWADLGEMFYQAGSFEEAADAYRKAVELDPEAGWLKSNLALALAAQGKAHEAISLYGESLECITDDQAKAVTWNRLGEAYRKLGDFENAVSAFLRADELGAKSSRLWNPESGSQELDGADEIPDPAEEAARDFVFTTSERRANLTMGGAAPSVSPLAPKGAPLEEETTAEIPGSGNSNFEALLLKTMETGRTAPQAKSPKASVTPTPSHLSDAEATDEKQSEEPSSARRSMPDSLQTGSEAIPPKVGKAQVAAAPLGSAPRSENNASAKKDESAVGETFFEEYLEDFFRSIQSSEEEATAEATKFNPVAVNPEMGKAGTEADNQNPQVWNELGTVYFNSGAYDNAILAYKQAIELDPQFAWAYCNLALAYAQKDCFAEAILLYRRSIELFKSSKDKAVTWNRLGNLYRQHQDYEQAILAYQTADELDPGTVSAALRSRFNLLGNLAEKEPAYV